MEPAQEQQAKYSFRFIILVVFMMLSLIVGLAVRIGLEAYATTEIKTSVKPILTLGISGMGVDLQSTTGLGNFVSGSIDLLVSTNSSAGYSLLLSGLDNSRSLKHENNSDLIIPSINQAVIKASFPNDAWGFSLDGENFQQIPSLDSVNIKRVNSKVKDDSTSLHFGIKATDNSVAGRYSGGVKLSVIINSAYEPTPGRTIFDLTTMQEMTSEICGNTTTPYAFFNNNENNPIASTITRVFSEDRNLVPEVELRDIRDNKIYVVRKLADGRCWMVQNLDLELTTDLILTPENSDVTRSWRPNCTVDPNTNYPFWGSYNAVDDGVESIAYNQSCYYNPGEVYYIGDNNSPQQASNTGPRTAHAGNYYNFYAISAGTASGGISNLPNNTNITDSICPKGWRLPMSGNNANHNKGGEIRKLTNLYRISSGEDPAADAVSLLKVPFSIVQAGYYTSGQTQLESPGSSSMYFSSTVWNKVGINQSYTDAEGYYEYDFSDTPSFLNNGAFVYGFGQYENLWGAEFSIPFWADPFGLTARCIAK